MQPSAMRSAAPMQFIPIAKKWLGKTHRAFYYFSLSVV